MSSAPVIVTSALWDVLWPIAHARGSRSGPLVTRNRAAEGMREKGQEGAWLFVVIVFLGRIASGFFRK